MKKKLLTLFVIGTLSACGQTDSGAAPQADAPKTAMIKNTEMPAELQVTHVDATKAADIMKARPELVVIDVRTPREFARSHIVGAINIDYKNANFSTEIAKLDGAQDYLIHCGSGGRSTAALKKFKAQGFSHIIHMDGGMNGWNKANLPTVK